MMRAADARLLILAALVGACAWAAQAAPADRAERGLDFGSVFSDKGEPDSLHFRARYLAADGASHQVEVWRDGQSRLRRSADGKLETYVQRVGGTDDFSMEVLDASRRIATRIDRANLYRIGTFTDWYDLAHILKHPMAAYQLTATGRPEHAAPPVEECQWYALTQRGATTHICWSARDRIPIVIQNAASSWVVTSVDRERPAEGTFEVDHTGFIRNDANQDIDKD